MRTEASINWRGEFTSPDNESAYRQSQAGQEVRQMRCLWSLALAFFFAYSPVDLAEHDAGAEILALRMGIILLGLGVLLAVSRPAVLRHRDALTGLVLLLAMSAYGAIVGLRPGTSSGALLLLLVGSYLFSPCRFALHVTIGCLGSAAAVFCVLATGGQVDWLECSYLVPANLLAGCALAQANRARRRLYWQGRELRQEIERRQAAQTRLALANRKNLSLLYKALPREVARQLKRNPGCPVARELTGVAILFADIAGFSRLAGRLTPRELVAVLNALFSRFDHLSTTHGVEKIKTIGDAYLAVAGIASPQGATVRAARLALVMSCEAKRLSARLGVPLSLRIGLHTGPVVAGVLGTHRFAFDVWGENVNIASRLQAAAPIDGILVSQEARLLCPESLAFGAVREYELRGCGRRSACLLEGDSAVPQLSRDLRRRRLG